MDEPTVHLEVNPRQSITMAASNSDGMLMAASNDPPGAAAEQGLQDLSNGVVEEGETSTKNNTLERGAEGLQDPPVVLQPGDNLIPLVRRLPLPPQLVEMWTRIDSTLDSATAARVIQETYIEYDTSQPPAAQPWTRPPESTTTTHDNDPNHPLLHQPPVATAAAVSITAVEKARIAHDDGDLPASWRAASEGLAHGRKWLAIGAQRREEAAARARAAEAAEQERAARRQAQRAQQAAAGAALEAKGAERRAREAGAAADRAVAAARRAARGAAAAQRKGRRVLAAWEGGREPPREGEKEEKGRKAAAGEKRGAGEKEMGKEEDKKKKPRAKADKAKPKTAPSAAGAAAAPRGRKRKIQEANL